MRELLLKRIFHDNLVTLGVLYLDHVPALVTLEKPWNDNKRQISSIPVGSYNCEAIKHPKFGLTLHLLAVPDRDGILVHSGNHVDDTSGCIIVGMSFDCRNDRRMVVDSGFAMRRLREYMGNDKAFKLRIIYA